MNTPNDKQTVFISYAHEDDLGSRVAGLARFLADRGIEVITDHPYQNRPPESGWRVWMQQGIEDADVVLIVCTERYKEIFEKREPADDGGRGVGWESAIITADIYRARMLNSRFFPILPDDGHRDHVPAVLVDWHNDHRFPSGNERILALVRGDSPSSTPQSPSDPSPSGELRGADDPRLRPRKDKLLGREEELAQVLAFLRGTGRSATVRGYVAGSAGIGKTEVCKAALERWLRGKKATRAFWVQVDDDADGPRLVRQLGETVGLAPETCARLSEVSHVRPYLPEGLYYLDNLESVAESDGGWRSLRALGEIPGIRVLASSRVSLDGVLGQGIPIGPLDPESARELFARRWAGSDTIDAGELSRFVEKELGHHALSIVLIARLGKAYRWKRIQTLWKEHGTAIATARRKSNDRLDSLTISFSLTADLLRGEPGALDLWQFAALFPGGFHEDTLNRWEEISGHHQARVALVDHHLLVIDAGLATMLPPIARYALEQAGKQAGPHVTNGRVFDWESARDSAYRYFLSLSREASDIASSDAAIQSRRKSSEQLWAVERLAKTDLASGRPHKGAARQLHQQLRNTYAFDVLAGRAVLGHVNDMLGDGLSEHLLGDLESQLGNVDTARGHYDTAIDLYQKEQDRLGLAHALQALGSLERRLGNLDKARDHYDTAIDLYKKEQDQLGLANALEALGRIESRLGNLDRARGHYDTAIDLYQKEQDQLGLANVYQSLGDLLLAEDRAREALPVYQDAISLYRAERDPMGLAYTLAEVIRCHSRLGGLSGDELRELAMEAIDQAKRSGVDSVLHYVRSALLAFFEGDGGKLKTFLESTGADD